MHALGLVLADDDVLERGARLEQEDGVGVAALGLLVAGARAAVVLGPAAVKGGAGGDHDHGRVGLGRGRRGQAALVAQTCEGMGHGGEERAQAEQGSIHFFDLSV